MSDRLGFGRGLGGESPFHSLNPRDLLIIVRGEETLKSVRIEKVAITES